MGIKPNKTEILWVLLVSAALPLFGQNPTGWDTRRTLRFTPGPSQQLLDTFLIDPSSLELAFAANGQTVDSNWYQLKNNRLYWMGPSDSLAVEARFRILPYRFDARLVRIDSASLMRGGAGPFTQEFLYRPTQSDRPPTFDFRGLEYRGTFARGLSFGNRQDLVLNSRFNMQLAGQLGDDVEILAAISDENIPLQPQGNTLQLQELDRVFIRLSRKNTSLTAGDYELARPTGRFINYFKKLQGLTVRHEQDLGPLGKAHVEGSVAINRGQFARVQLATTEGNQGPYRLQGNQNERFLVVLAGTERVWLDGELLQRGIESDYIIDYNRGDITFTHRKLITKDSRVIVEFEYSTQSYLQSFYAVNGQWTGKKHELFFNLASQQDSKNSTVGFDLSDGQKQLLQSAGDQNDLSLPAVDTLSSFDPQQVAYYWKDSTFCQGTTGPILVFTNDPALANVRAQFTFVGSGNGNYVIDNRQNANERVYRWVAPGPDCTPSGDYEPVIRLRPPRQQQMLSFGGRWNPGREGHIRAELSMSRLDLNRFSPLDAGDDLGWAAFLNAGKNFRLGRDSSGWQLKTDAAYEFKQRDFRFFNPYRNQEFLRDWGLTDVQGIGTVDPANEHWMDGGIRLEETGHFALFYRLGGFLRDSSYQGLRHLFGVQLNKKGWEIDATGSLLQSQDTLQRTEFFRPKILVAKTLSGKVDWRVGVFGEREKKSRYNPETGNLLPGSFFFDRFKAFVETRSDGPYSFGASYVHRKDYGIAPGDFREANLAREANVNAGWSPNPRIRFAGNITYRNLTVLNQELSRQDPAETILGRTNLNLALLKGALRSNTTYELGTGQEPRLNFTFIRVAVGEGDYIWLDSLFNQDGIIQPQEMVLAPFPDQADYVRITTITDEFIPSNFVNLNQSLSLNPRAVWFNEEGIKGFLSRFSTQSSLKINRKVQKDEGVSPWNPFGLDVADTSLVAISSRIQNVLYFNRAHPVYSLEIGQQDQRRKQVQTNGFESRDQTEYFLRGRVNFNQKWTLEMETKIGTSNADSEQFQERQYKLGTFRLAPEISFQPSAFFRGTLTYQFGHQENAAGLGGEESLDHQLALETTLSRPKYSLRTNLSWVQFQFDGKASSPVGFAMLKGLQPGRNLLWNASFDRQLSKNIRLSLNYEGRKTGNAQVVHIGRAQVAATF